MKMRRITKVIVGLGFALLVSFGFTSSVSPAGAQDDPPVECGGEYQPSCPVECSFEYPLTVQIGEVITITGNTTNGPITFSIGGVELGTADDIDDNGDFSVTLTIGPDVPLGDQTIVGDCGGDDPAVGPIEVLAADDPGGPGGGGNPPGGGGTGGTGGTGGAGGGTGGGALARTGVDARPIVTLGAAALVLGGAALYGSKRRRVTA